MSEYYCSHKPPCCVELDALKAANRGLSTGVDSMQSEINRLKTELKEADRIWVINMENLKNELVQDRDLWKAKAEKLAKVIYNLEYYDEASVLKAKDMLADFEKGE